MNAIFWFLLGVITVGVVLATAMWIENRWHRVRDALPIGYSTTSSHGLALTSRREPRTTLAGVVTRRFVGRHEVVRTTPR